uniref:Uncharacterized protein n=1 Tax=Anas platyrhynchos TaxID=8839 RepID=A0A8B9SGK0_ANAPL
LPLGALLDGRKGVAVKEQIRRVQLHVGLHKGSPGEFTCTQSLPLGALLDGPRGIAMRFLMPAFSVFSHSKERIRRVQLHVGLRKGSTGEFSCSPGEFTCTQSLHLGALLDGRKGLGKRFMRPEISVVSHAG